MSASPVARAVTRLLCMLLLSTSGISRLKSAVFGMHAGSWLCEYSSHGCVEPRDTKCRLLSLWTVLGKSCRLDQSISSWCGDLCLSLLFRENLFHSAPCGFNSVPQDPEESDSTCFLSCANLIAIRASLAGHFCCIIAASVQWIHLWNHFCTVSV